MSPALSLPISNKQTPSLPLPSPSPSSSRLPHPTPLPHRPRRGRACRVGTHVGEHPCIAELPRTAQLHTAHVDPLGIDPLLGLQNRQPLETLPCRFKLLDLELQVPAGEWGGAGCICMPSLPACSGSMASRPTPLGSRLGPCAARSLRRPTPSPPPPPKVPAPRPAKPRTLARAGL